MEKERKRRKVPGGNEIKNMITYRKQGMTYVEIGEHMDFHHCTVYRFTKDVEVDRGRIKYKRDLIIELLKSGKPIKEIASLANSTQDYVRKIKETKEVKKIQRKKDEVKKVKNNRQKEIEKINEELRRQKEKQEKEWEEEKHREIEYQVERYPYAFS